MMRRFTVVVAVLAITVAAAGLEPATADHQLLHSEPQGPAKVRFPDDFRAAYALTDHEWDFEIGGFGGVAAGAPRSHHPVIFVHGNVVDHADWYPVRDDFRAAGWTDQELWALSYNGLGNNSGSAAQRQNPERDAEHAEMGSNHVPHSTSNDVNVADLHDFIAAVRDYTRSDRFSIVAHSLGVTLARKMLAVHTDLRDDLVAFVAIAGPNHGTSLCPPGSEGVVVGCDEIAAGTDWLADLNGPGGSDETYGPARWMTVYDGSGWADIAYTGPYADSPRLEGADNRAYGRGHNDLRLDPAIVAEYRSFIEASEALLAEPAGGPGASGPHPVFATHPGSEHPPRS